MADSQTTRPRPSLSITLPPSFKFSTPDGQLPKTPDMPVGEGQSAQEPPPPPRQPAFRVRRKPRTSLTTQEPEIVSSDNTAIPTIEMSEAASDFSSPVIQPTVAADGLLSPLPAMQRISSEPRTPAPRAQSPFGSPSNEWSLITNSRQQQPYSRAGSVFSDSSVSSCGSSDFSAPTNGSRASPSSEAADYFVEKKDGDAVFSPAESSSPPRAKRVKTSRQKTKWTTAMDEHLWMTFVQYISDPRLTPFKSLPGTAPPLGVCSRVASKARRTWSQHKQATPVPLEQTMRDGTPDTIRASDVEKQPQWPRREKETRRRLKDMCRRRPSLHAHYQRLLRSPSPFLASSDGAQPSQPANSFSSRDLNISLTTATAPSMQPGAPLAQLSEATTPRPQSQRDNRPAHWFSRIGRSQAHQKSISLQTGLQLQDRNTTAGIYASLENNNRNHLLQSMTATRSLGRADVGQGPGRVPMLDSPVDFQHAPTFPRSLKRRFKSDEEKPKRPEISSVFDRASENILARRNRGFSLGAAHASDTLAHLFVPPPTVPTLDEIDQEMNEAAGPDYYPPPFTTHKVGDNVFNDGHVDPLPLRPVQYEAATGSLPQPRQYAQPVPRLGSPFVARNNTFPRSYQATPENPQPFRHHLREILRDQAEKKRMV